MQILELSMSARAWNNRGGGWGRGAYHDAGGKGGGTKWILTPEQVWNSPSREHMPEEAERGYRRSACNVIHHLVERLDMDCIVQWTALIFLQRFYSRNSFASYEPTLMAATCVLLAGKVEERAKKLKEIVKHYMAYMDTPREEQMQADVELEEGEEPGEVLDNGSANVKAVNSEALRTLKKEPPDLRIAKEPHDQSARTTYTPEQIEALKAARDALLQNEKLLLYTLEFDLNVTRPFVAFKQLRQMVIELCQHIIEDEEVFKLAASLLWDSLRTPACLLCDSATLGAVAMYIAVRSMSLPEPAPRTWKTVLELERHSQLLEALLRTVQSAYDESNELWPFIGRLADEEQPSLPLQQNGCGTLRPPPQRSAYGGVKGMSNGGHVIPGVTSVPSFAGVGSGEHAHMGMGASTGAGMVGAAVRPYDVQVKVNSLTQMPYHHHMGTSVKGAIRPPPPRQSVGTPGHSHYGPASSAPYYDQQQVDAYGYGAAGGGYSHDYAHSQVRQPPPPPPPPPGPMQKRQQGGMGPRSSRQPAWLR